MRAIAKFITTLIISLFRLHNLVKVIQTTNISYYSYGMRELAIKKFHLETYDIIMFVLFALYLIYNIWYKPELRGKAKNINIALHIIFHVLIFGLVIYECGINGEYNKMIINLGLYIVIEAVVYLIEYIHENKESKKDQKPMK